MDNVVIKKYNSKESLKESIDLCNGFENFNSNNSILIKPNLVYCQENHKTPPYGVVTTTRIIKDIIELLKDYGIDDITIGEGSVIFNDKGTEEAFKTLGYYELKKKYGIKLIDFNECKYKKHELHDDFHLHIAEPVFECDHIINVPVLKTHALTKVSLGLKNLKGCLSIATKKNCHNKKYDLEYCIAQLASIINPDLTIIDGTYTIERGPLYQGTAHYKNIIVASKNILAADCVGASLLGFNPGEINQFTNFSKIKETSFDLDTFSIKGDNIDREQTQYLYDFEWNEENTRPKSSKNFKIPETDNLCCPKYDNTMCTGCIGLYSTSLALYYLPDINTFPKTEILSGKKASASQGFENTILIGNCIIKNNSENTNIKNPIKIPGCPPQLEDYIDILNKNGYAVDKNLTKARIDYSWSKYSENSDFNLNYFKDCVSE